MKFDHRFRCLLSCLIVAGLSPCLLAEEVRESEPDYIRYDAEADLLQTAAVQFRRGDETVDLIAVVHLADEAYFAKLNKYLASYDLVFYEMMGGEFVPEDSAVRPEGEMGKVRGLQEMATSLLGLSFQLTEIDYSQKNFIHADVDWDEYDGLMTERNQDFGTLFSRAMTLAENGEIEGMGTDAAATSTMMTSLLSGVMTGDSSALKRVIAPFMSESEGLITKLEGKDGTVILTERNKVVMRDLAEQTANNPSGRYAIFYGAGHMPDLERRLLAEGYTREKVAWLDAWTIEDSSAADGSTTSPAVSGMSMLMKVMAENPEIMQLLQEIGSAAPAPE